MRGWLCWFTVKEELLQVLKKAHDGQLRLCSQDVLPVLKKRASGALLAVNMCENPRFWIFAHIDARALSTINTSWEHSLRALWKSMIL